jgi:putative ABC transport system substrate-binding protein
MTSTMARFIVQIGLAAAIVLVSACAFADEIGKLPQIGMLLGAGPSTAKPYAEAFQDGMRALGYVEGKNVNILTRYANGDPTRHPVLLKELIALRVDVLVVTTAGVAAAKAATSVIPIVCPVFGSDPVRDGLVASLAHPGGNVTGQYPLGSETDSKRLQFAIELVPALKRAALLFEPANPGWVADASALQTVAQSSGVTLHTYGVRDQVEIRAALAGIEKDRSQALIVFNSPLNYINRDVILNWARHRLPVIGEGRDWAESGALLTYSANFFELFRRSATYVDKILKGAKAASLPIEQSTKFELVVNLRTAKDLGINVPQSILVQADEVIR